MVRKSVLPEDIEERIDVSTLLRAETSVARSLQGWTEDAASRPRNGAKAWFRLRHKQTRDSPALTFHAEAVCRHAGSPIEEKRAERLR